MGGAFYDKDRIRRISEKPTEKDKKWLEGQLEIHRKKPFLAPAEEAEYRQVLETLLAPAAVPAVIAAAAPAQAAPKPKKQFDEKHFEDIEVRLQKLYRGIKDRKKQSEANLKWLTGQQDSDMTEEQRKKIQDVQQAILDFKDAGYPLNPPPPAPAPAPPKPSEEPVAPKKPTKVFDEKHLEDADMRVKKLYKGIKDRKKQSEANLKWLTGQLDTDQKAPFMTEEQRQKTQGVKQAILDFKDAGYPLNPPPAAVQAAVAKPVAAARPVTEAPKPQLAGPAIAPKPRVVRYAEPSPVAPESEEPERDVQLLPTTYWPGVEVIGSEEPPAVPYNPLFLKSFYKPMKREDLLEAWDGEERDIIGRDTILEAMRQRGIFPQTWSHHREKEAGLYPNIYDPDFAGRLAQKAEFSELRSETISEDICTTSQSAFDTTPVQRLVARFLHPSTPYRGLLLDHGVGVGKTCTAITVAEMYLDVLPQNKVIILCPQAIASGFRRTIFDAERLTQLPPRESQLRGEVWESSQCTGMTYPRLVGVENEKDRVVVESAVNRVISKRYQIMGYLAFANLVQGRLNALSKTLEGQEREDAENKLLYEMFSDHLLIIDEAHNLRDSGSGAAAVAATIALPEDTEESPAPTAAADAAEGKRLTPILKRILRVSEGLRLLMMTATPMYNTAPEILFLLNLMILNDTKDESKLIQQRAFFSNEGALLPSAEKSLRDICSRYISYMRGENPASFPLRLTPPTAAGPSFFNDEYPTKSVSRAEGTVKMTSDVKQILSVLPIIVHTPSITDTVVGKRIHTILQESRKAPDEEGVREVSDFILDQTMQMANICYPDGAFGSRGWDQYWKDSTTGRVRQFTWNPPEEMPDLKAEDVFGAKGLASHAPKIAAIVESVTRAKGMSFVFSRYVKAGALPIAAALELMGWTRVLKDGSPFSIMKNPSETIQRQCALCQNKEGGEHVGHSFMPANFVLLTGDEGLTPDFKATLAYANTLRSPTDVMGGKVKAILGSQIASEGLDLKCIRENHLLDGWYHLNRIEQVVGRAVRYCSHVSLPTEHRNCLIYMHTVAVPEFETADLYAYRIAARKSIAIGAVQRIIKTSAWDCLMNRDAILLKGLKPRRVEDAQGRMLENYDPHDRPFTSICDFQEACEYQCSAKSLRGVDTSTYQPMDARRRFLEKQKILRELFSKEIAYPIDLLKKTTYGDMPWEIASVGLRAILENPQFVIQRTDGIRGTLALQNGYVVFKPLSITDNTIPLALRFGRAYGILPRTMRLRRDTVLESKLKAKETELPQIPLQAPADIVVKKQAAPAKAAAAKTAAPKETKAPEEFVKEAEESLRVWNSKLDQIFSAPRFQAGLQTVPEIPKTFFDAWHWILHYFRGLKETPQIARKWWVDYHWTLDQREAVLRDMTIHSDAHAELRPLFRPVELFTGGLAGYNVLRIHEAEPKKSKVQSFCFMEDTPEPEACPSNLQSVVNSIIGPSVDIRNDTGPLFGFLIPEVEKKATVVFKSVNKAEGRLNGAKCTNVSNLVMHHTRITLIQNQIWEHLESHPICNILLDTNDSNKVSDAERKERQKNWEIEHVTDLTKTMSCLYMEFLLRFLDYTGADDKRWFLSMVDAVRAGYTVS